MTYKRIDHNQSDIVKELRQLGFTVAVISMVGKGIPDIIVGHRGKNFLFEIKDGNKNISQQSLTKNEEKFHREWSGQIDIIRSTDDAIDLIMSDD
jgi:Holliday junction resolvase